MAWFRCPDPDRQQPHDCERNMEPVASRLRPFAHLARQTLLQSKYIHICASGDAPDRTRREQV